MLLSVDGPILVSVTATGFCSRNKCNIPSDSDSVLIFRNIEHADFGFAIELHLTFSDEFLNTLLFEGQTGEEKSILVSGCCSTNKRSLFHSCKSQRGHNLICFGICLGFEKIIVITVATVLFSFCVIKVMMLSFGRNVYDQNTFSKSTNGATQKIPYWLRSSNTNSVKT